MSRRLIVMSLLLASVVGGGLWNWRQQQEVVRLRAQVGSTRAATKRERTPQSASTSSIRSNLQTATADTAEAPTAPTTANRAPIAAPPAPTATTPGKPEQDPEVAAEHLKLGRLEAGLAVEREYQPFFLMLAQNGAGSPELFEQAKALLVQREQFTLEFEGDAFSTTLAGFENQLRATLGEPAYARLQEYRATENQRDVIRVASQQLAPGTPPLTSAQTEQLVALLRRFPARGERPASPISEEAVAAAAEILSPEHLAAVRQVQSYHKSYYEVNARLSRLQRPPAAR